MVNGRGQWNKIFPFKEFRMKILLVNEKKQNIQT